jgi:phage-related protein (TIGR01555 family)
MTKDISGSWISKLKDVMGVTYSKVADSFNNAALRYGPQSNAIGGQTWSNERLSNQWQMLRVMYRTNSLARRLVDVAAKDMTREPLIFTGSCDPGKLDELQQQWAKLQIAKKVGFGLSMARLFGGVIVYLDIAWQDSADELDISTIAKGQFLGLKVYHRWQLSPSIEVDPITECPIYYDVTSGSSTYTTDREDNQLIKRIHSSRCIKLDGDNLEYYDWIENLRWGASIFEQGYDRLLYLNTGIAAIAGILTKASQQVYKVNDLQSVIASGDNGRAETPLDRAIALMSKYRNTENMMVIDAMDAMEIHNYQLSGIDSLVNQLRLEICTAYRYPVTKIYLDSPSGLNATGENDTRMYYDEIKAAQEESLRAGYEVLTKIIYQSTFGKPPAKDFNFKFAPLWQMSAKEKSEIAINNVNAINIAFSSGIISQEVALKELRQMADATDLFTNITDEDLENSETSDPPSPEDLAGEMSLNAKKAEAGNEKEDIKDDEEDGKDSDKKAI